MLDHNLLFSDAQVLADDAWSTSALKIGKTPAEGVWVEVVITATADGAKTVLAEAFAQDADAGWATTSDKVGAMKAPSALVQRYWFKIQTKRPWVKIHYECSAAGAFTVTAGIASGPGQDALV